MIVLKCKICNGTGVVNNMYFEICARLDEEVLAHYNMRQGECRKCPFRSRCNEGEFTDCANCDGRGKLLLDERDWEICLEMDGVID